MNRRCIGTLVILLAASLLAFGRQETLEQLMTRADAAPTEKQADLCAKVADQELKLTVAAYEANKPDQGRSALDQVVKYSDKAHAAAIRSGKKLKHTEIDLRKISERLHDLKLNANADDQPVIQMAIDKLESFRTELLHSMFGPKK